MFTETPESVTLVLADQVFRDQETGKWIIAGVFNTIGGSTYPLRHGRVDVFFQVTNVSKPVDLRLRIEHADGTVIVDLGGPISTDSPLNMIESKVSLLNLAFPRPGKYFVQLQSGEEILSAVPLFLKQLQERPREEPKL